MTDDTLMKNGNISSTAANINQCDTSFFFFLAQHRFRRSQRLQYQFLGLQPGIGYTPHDILHCCDLTGNDVEVSFQTHPSHTYRIFHSRLIINCKLLWQHMDDFFSRGHNQFKHIINQFINILLANFTVQLATCQNPTML
ncbi:hypothetical protein D3C87_1401180 [compost metagenome]